MKRKKLDLVDKEVLYWSTLVSYRNFLRTAKRTRWGRVPKHYLDYIEASMDDWSKRESVDRKLSSSGRYVSLSDFLLSPRSGDKLVHVKNAWGEVILGGFGELLETLGRYIEDERDMERTVILYQILGRWNLEPIWISRCRSCRLLISGPGQVEGVLARWVVARHIKLALTDMNLKPLEHPGRLRNSVEARRARLAVEKALSERSIEVVRPPANLSKRPPDGCWHCGSRETSAGMWYLNEVDPDSLDYMLKDDGSGDPIFSFVEDTNDR